MAQHQELTELDRLIKESEEAIKRLEAAQRGSKGVPLPQRLAAHIKKNSSSFINILMAGSVLVVALGRMVQKAEFETQKEQWEEERRKLTVERNRVQEQLAAYKLSTESLVSQVEAAAAAGGRHMADDVRRILQGHRDAQRQLEQHSPAVAALLHSAQAAAAQQQQQPTKPPGDKKIMV